MQTNLLQYIKKEDLFSPSDRILLTVSGGIDSVVMCDLFHKAGFNFAIAHCNFRLRGKESEQDEAFVKGLAKKYKIPFFCKRFNTSAFAEEKNMSIQMAARELRYKWFEEIRGKEELQYIATAHHQDDSIETFFINFIRGTGISGLHGILPKQGKVIRPLLFSDRNSIESYAKKHKLNHREDSSNASDKYMRNKLRLQIIPALKELNPALAATVTENIQRLKDVELIYSKEVEDKRSNIVKGNNKNITIPIKQLKKLQPLATYLYEFLKPYHFNASTVDSIVEGLDGLPGKQFFSDTHRLIKDRDLLIIESQKPKKQILKSEKFEIKKNQKKLILDRLILHFQTLHKKHNTRIPKPSSECMDLDKLEFPLEVRKWQQGDFFYPLGMKGKKKLSDFFIDKKLSIDQKENTWLLTSKGAIVWVIGLRMDDRFKITDKTQRIYLAELV